MALDRQVDSSSVLSPLVVLRGVKAFHRSPSSPLSMKATSVNTSFPGVPARGYLLGRHTANPPASRGVLSAHAKGGAGTRGRQGSEVRPTWGPLQSARHGGPWDRSLVMPRLNIQSAEGLNLHRALSFGHGTEAEGVSFSLGVPPGTERARTRGERQGRDGRSQPPRPLSCLTRTSAPSPASRWKDHRVDQSAASRFRMEVT